MNVMTKTVRYVQGMAIHQKPETKTCLLLLFILTLNKLLITESHTSSSGRLCFQIRHEILLWLVHTIFLHFCCLKKDESKKS